MNQNSNIDHPAEQNARPEPQSGNGEQNTKAQVAEKETGLSKDKNSQASKQSDRSQPQTGTNGARGTDLP